MTKQGTQHMNIEALQTLLLALLETAQAIAGDPRDPMNQALRQAAAIHAVDASGDGALTVTLTDGACLRLLITE
jgi:hypothetical protein